MILGANGFIGSALTAAVLRESDWQVFGIDLADDKLSDLQSSPRFRFAEGDITINREWVEYHIKKSDVVVPLVAIANPAQYVTEPLRVFELDFEANLAIVRLCLKYGKRARRGNESARLRAGEQTALDLCGLETAARPRYLRLRRPRRVRLHPVSALQLHRAESRQRRRAQGRQLARVHAVPLEHHVPPTDPAGGWRRAEALVHVYRRRH